MTRPLLLLGLLLVAQCALALPTQDIIDGGCLAMWFGSTPTACRCSGCCAR